MAPLEALGGSALFSDIFIGQDPKLFGRVSERSPKFLLPRSAFTAPIEGNAFVQSVLKLYKETKTLSLKNLAKKTNFGENLKGLKSHIRKKKSPKEL